MTPITRLTSDRVRSAATSLSYSGIFVLFSSIATTSLKQKFQASIAATGKRSDPTARAPRRLHLKFSHVLFLFSLMSSSCAISRDVAAQHVQSVPDPAILKMVDAIVPIAIQEKSHDAALALANFGYQLSIRAKGPRSIEAAVNANRLGNVMRSAGLSDQALYWYSLSEDLLKNHANTDTLRLINLLNSAHAAEEANNLTSADKFYRLAVIILREIRNKDVDIAQLERQVQLGIAGVHSKHSRLVQSEAMLKKLLADIEPNTNHAPDALAIRGINFLLRGMHDEAIGLLRAAASATRNVDGRAGIGTGGLTASGLLDKRRHIFRYLALALSLSNSGDHASVDEALGVADELESTEAGDAITALFAPKLSPLSKSQEPSRQLLDQVLRPRSRNGQEFRRAISQITSAILEFGTVGSEERLKASLREFESLLIESGTSYLGLAQLASRQKAKFGIIKAVQDVLQSDEAMVRFLVVPSWVQDKLSVIAWYIDQNRVQARIVEMASSELHDLQQRLRCGLDREGTWLQKDSPEARNCERLFLGRYTLSDARQGKPLPFDVGAAHRLYAKLLGSFQDLILEKRILIVPSNVLAAVPFSALVVAEPRVGTVDNYLNFRTTEWLGTRNAIVVYPSVAGLILLKQLTRNSSVGNSYLGVGNPILNGRLPGHFNRASLARSLKSCALALKERVGIDKYSTTAPIHRRADFSDVRELLKLAPLPETAWEVCRVAQFYGRESVETLLGLKATESEIRSLSESGALARYRVIHFATHALTWAQAGSAREPGLVLSPPTYGIMSSRSLKYDDGFLSATDIARLKLDADLVILSACNTSGGLEADRDAFSGLARAFLTAGARAVLASHWEVDSQATVELIVGALGQARSSERVHLSEALRRSMRQLMQKGRARHAHPASWAPFVLFGGG